MNYLQVVQVIVRIPLGSKFNQRRQLADLKQMFRFALARELVDRNPLDTITKRQVGGADVERSRVLDETEIRLLGAALKNASMTRSQPSDSA